MRTINFLNQKRSQFNTVTKNLNLVIKKDWHPTILFFDKIDTICD